MRSKSIIKIHKSLEDSLAKQSEKEDDIDDFIEESNEMFDGLNILFQKVDEFVKAKPGKVPSPMPILLKVQYASVEERDSSVEEIKKLMDVAKDLMVELTQFKADYKLYCSGTAKYRNQMSQFLKLLQSFGNGPSIDINEMKMLERKSNQFTQEVYKLHVTMKEYSIRLNGLKQQTNRAKGVN